MTEEKTCVKVLRWSKECGEEELRNQHMTLDPFIEKQGWRLIGTITLNGVKRWDMITEAKESVLRPLKNLKPSYVVYRDHNRIGFQNPGQQGWYITELESLGAILVTADNGREVSMKQLPDTLTTVQNQLACDAEIEKKAYQAHIGRRKTVERKSTPGKPIPYGYDMMVVDRQGQPKYKITLEGRGEWQGRNLRKRPLFRTKIYLDGSGRQEAYNDTWVDGKIVKCVPMLEKGDRKFETPNPERAEVVKEIFRLSDGPNWKTQQEIVNILTQQGYKPYGDRWESHAIKYILRNPIYKGYPIDNVNHVGVAKIEYTDPYEFPLTEAEREALRIISVQQWDRVNKYLDTTLNPHKRKRRAYLGHLWAKDFVTCGCGRPLYCHGACPQKPNGNAYSCLCGYVKAEVIHDMINRWLQSLNQSNAGRPQRQEGDVEGIVNAVENLNCQMGIQNNSKKILPKVLNDMLRFVTNHRLKEVGDSMNLNWLWEATPRTFTHNSTTYQTGGWQEESIVAMYQEVFTEVTTPITEEVAKLKAEKRQLLAKLDTLADNDPDVREWFLDKQRQIETLESQITSLMPKYGQQQKHLAELFESSRQLTINPTEADGENKAVMLRNILDKVVVTFDGTGKRKHDCKMVRVEIVAKTNDAADIPPLVFDAEECAATLKQLKKRRGEAKKLTSLLPA